MLKCRQDLDALRQTARSAYNAQAEKIIVCAGTGCVAGGSLKVFDRLKELLEAQNIPVEVRLEELETPAAFNILQGVVYEIRFLRTEGPLLYALELRPSPDQTGAENAGDGQTPAPGPDENGPENAGTSATDGLWGELYGGLDDSLLPAHTAAGLDSERDEWLRRLENTENAVLRAGLPGAPGGNLPDLREPPVVLAHLIQRPPGRRRYPAQDHPSPSSPPQIAGSPHSWPPA